MLVPNVAVVDDDPDFRALMAAVLGDEGFRPAVSSSADAWESISRMKPSVILLDIGWPSLESQRPPLGIALSRRLEQDPSTRDIPVIVCSGDRRALQTYGDGLQQRSWEVLEKPFDLDQMLDAITSAITERRRAR